MAVNTFISFRFSDGKEIKDDLIKVLEEKGEISNRSEDKDRSGMTDETIRKYLYDKLKYTSLTIVVLTPNAVNYKNNNLFKKYDDWLYDELRYSLEDRENNRTNAIIAVYTKDAASQLYTNNTHTCEVCNETTNVKSLNSFTNLVRKNMLNVKDEHKFNQCKGIYDSNKDSYISLVSLEDFINNSQKYIDFALEKRDRITEFNLVKRMD